ncbi:rna-directed dna polymerase from mobile element jockey-like [Pitangus sulphuratus]|nr:rna-directed dna polymerase from mobile element jockey-like [Pitangus sulphuratus]
MTPSCVVLLTCWKKGMSSRETLTGLRVELYQSHVIKAKCKVLHLDQGNPKHKYRLGRDCIKSNPEEKDLKVSVRGRLDMNRQFALKIQKAKCILDSIKRSVASRSREVILPIYSALMKSHLEYWVPRTAWTTWTCWRKSREGPQR